MRHGPGVGVRRREALGVAATPVPDFMDSCRVVTA
jgi:hypothetical protein